MWLDQIAAELKIPRKMVWKEPDQCEERLKKWGNGYKAKFRKYIFQPT